MLLYCGNAITLIGVQSDRCVEIEETLWFEDDLESLEIELIAGVDSEQFGVGGVLEVEFNRFVKVKFILGRDFSADGELAVFFTGDFGLDGFSFVVEVVIGEET